MAKRKTKKVEEVIDLTKPEKVTDEQLKKIQSAVDRINQAQMNIGQLESRKHQALHFVAGVNDELGMLETKKHSILHHVANMQEKLTLMQDEFTKEYGTADINIQDGAINYKDEQADKKD